MPIALRPPPAAWQFALTGALVSVPVGIAIEQLPHSVATPAGSVMVLGAAIAGALAARFSTDPDAAGARAGVLGAGLSVISSLVRAITAPTDAQSSVGALLFAGVIVVCLAPLFGLACGRLGAWVDAAVTGRDRVG
ncbi:DUF5518 domain-containing protein [Halovenus salina]|uniref:DUF5518 domain-containing protein n=1 Tax=Halovenus salina TaxID=1510225 RepID=A0ABD5W2Z9_9EURY|nr:DUF5518 domain-containing protein [Halovenus salina]